MASQRHTPKQFPLGLFMRQWNEAGESHVGQEDVHSQALRSRKHATVEISIATSTGGAAHPIPDIVIAKYFEKQDQKLLRREQDVLSHATSVGIPVPRILHILDNFLVLERVDGRTLMDVVNDMGVVWEIKKEAVERLGAWLSAFHGAFKTHPVARRRGDANLRNFILTRSGDILGIDFEEAGMEEPNRDFYEVIDSILQSDPGIFTGGEPNIDWKYMLCERLLRSYVAAARKSPIDVIKDPAIFVDAQLMLMRDLATIRGSLNRLDPMLLAIKERMGDIIDRLISSDR